MHRELFGEDEDDDDDEGASKRDVEPFSISRNLIRRKQESATNNSLQGVEKMFAINAKEIDSIPPASVNKLNDFTSENKTKTSSSFVASLKSFLKCTKAINASSLKKVKEDYPLNLHLRMDQIFSIHDQLCDVAENFNDLYSTGERDLNFGVIVME